MWSMLYYLRNDPDKIKWSQSRRGLDPGVVDEARRLDELWRRAQASLDRLRHERNVVARRIGRARGSEREALISKAREIGSRIAELEREAEEYKARRDRLLLSIPNIVHETVPEGVDESDNVPVRYWGKPRVWRGHLEAFLREVEGHSVEYEVVDDRPLGHAEIVELRGWADVQRAAKVAGARFFYLLDDLVWLEYALIMYSLEFLAGKGFRIVEPPYMMRRTAYEGVISFEDFEDMIYKVEGEDLYLVATAEHPLAAMHMNEVLERDGLPLLYAGVSPCFRKEAGAHGKDTKGIFRVHQFNKVEQFVFCLPEESWDWHERLIANAEELWRGLGIPYRVVNICTGDLGAVAAKKYDLEAWMPAQGRYREMVSCSNCTDYQSYRLNIRYAKVRGAPAEGFVHTLNSTAIATTRAITAILENHQLPDGSVEIPKPLRKYLEPIEAAPKEVIRPLRQA